LSAEVFNQVISGRFRLQFAGNYRDCNTHEKRPQFKINDYSKTNPALRVDIHKKNNDTSCMLLKSGEPINWTYFNEVLNKQHHGVSLNAAL